MTDEELRDELITLLVAGHETTATALSWAFERLLRTPDALERLREEVAAGEDDYLDAVVQGDAAPAPGPADRRCARLHGPSTIGGHDLPAGVDGRALHHLVHRRPESTRTRTRSAPSASSSSRRAPTRGSRSAAACAAASARRSRCSRCKRC